MVNQKKRVEEEKKSLGSALNNTIPFPTRSSASTNEASSGSSRATNHDRRVLLCTISPRQLYCIFVFVAAAAAVVTAADLAVVVVDVAVVCTRSLLENLRCWW